MPGLAGSDEVTEFLSILKVGTRSVYAARLKLFHNTTLAGVPLEFS